MAESRKNDFGKITLFSMCVFSKFEFSDPGPEGRKLISMVFYSFREFLFLATVFIHEKYTFFFAAI